MDIIMINASSEVNFGIVDFSFLGLASRELAVAV